MDFLGALDWRVFWTGIGLGHAAASYKTDWASVHSVKRLKNRACLTAPHYLNMYGGCGYLCPSKSYSPQIAPADSKSIHPAERPGIEKLVL
jgi:hypothetical protein